MEFPESEVVRASVSPASISGIDPPETTGTVGSICVHEPRLLVARDLSTRPVAEEAVFENRSSRDACFQIH